MPVQKLKPSFNLEQDRIEMLKQLIPEAVSDGKIDWDVLKEALGEYLENEGADVEHFGLSWAGKREARRLASIPSKGTLVPVLGEGIDEDTTSNIFIEGDNLEVLKLLQKSYAGRIKMIYIDPPYNTGNDFIYKDDFSEPTEEYLKKTGQADEEGNLLTSNPKSSGRFHSNWLNMMYPRLRLAKSLLREDGIVFVSIDDNEVHNLKQIMDEIFGQECFLGSIVRSTGQTTGQDSGGFGTAFDYILSYSKVADIRVGGLPLSEKDIARFSDQDEMGAFNYWQLRKTGHADRREDRPKMYYPVEDPDGNMVYPIGPGGYESRWRCGQSTYKELVADNLILWKKIKEENGQRWWPYVKYYLEGRTKRPSPLWTDLDGSKKATKDLKDLLGAKVFDNPKPVALIKRLMQVIPDNDGTGIFVDFFAGSGSTAHSVFELNYEDNGNRKFICIQLPEKSPESSEAYKHGYLAVTEIGKERIRRISSQIGHEQNQKLDLNQEHSQDLGFKVYKLDRSNLKIWKDYDGEDIQAVEQLLLDFQNPLGESLSEEKVVTELQLLEGFPLDSKIDQSDTFTQNKVLCVTSEHIEHRLFICLDNKLDIATVQDVQLLEDEDIFVCLDNALTDQEKMMLADGCNVKTI